MTEPKTTVELGDYVINRDCDFIIAEPVCTNIALYNQGRQAVIDFGGDTVTFSGDLPVDEAARIFFEHIGDHLIEPIKRAERRRAADIARNGCLVPPDGGSPTEAERDMCEGIAQAIMRA